ncbi:MAG: MarR family transcriptional regulator [Deltaproteobacteria bacterium]|nr:MAG: MarR family transcriptional regulator [Deltaproteobacteria bacterium]
MSEPIDHENITSIDNAVAFQIHRFARLLRYNLQSMLRREADGLTPEQWFILFRLYEQDGQTQAELADRALNDRPNITRMLDKLEQKQLVARTAHPEDRRSYRIFLSRTGRSFVEDMFPKMIEERQRIFNGVSDEDLNHLLRTLKAIEKNL